jgi:hypothetical protein
MNCKALPEFFREGFKIKKAGRLNLPAHLMKSLR